MNDEQREFIVKKIDKYNEEIDREKEEDTLRVISIAVSATFALMLAANMEPGGGLAYQLINGAGIGANIAIALNNSKNLIKSIAERTGLQKAVIDLETKLGIDDLSSDKGKSR